MAFVLGAAIFVAHAAADTVELINGDVLRGAVIEQSGDVIVFEHADLGRMEIPREKISVIRIGESAPSFVAEVPPPIGPPPQITPPPPAVAPEPVVPPEEEPPPNPWTSRLELGVDVREGRTEDANLRVALISMHKTDDHTYTFDARYALASNRGDRTENKFTSGLHLIWPVPESRLEYFIDGRYDYDEFNSWDQRVTGGAGMGCKIIDLKKTVDDQTTDVLAVNINLGAGAKREFGSERDDLQPEGIVGTDLRWTLSPRQHVAATATYYPSLDDVDEFRFVSTAEWVVKLDWMKGLSFKVGFAEEYQSRTDPGVDHSFHSIFASLLVDF